MAQKRRPWTRGELLVALGLYLRVPFGQISQRNLEIIRFAGLLNRSPASLSMKMGNLASLDDSLERSGLRNASIADRAIWDEMQSDRLNLFDEIAQALSDLEAPESPLSDQAGVDVEATVKVRRGQHLFRRTVLSAYGHRCCVTGLGEPQLLVASHIRPWRDAPDARVDPRNGLCLNALHDRAFDRGLMTFDERMRVSISPALKDTSNEYVRLSLSELSGRPLRLPEKFAPDADALAYHREQIFIR